MRYDLKFEKDKFTVQTIKNGEHEIVYRAFENITYVRRPIDENIQKLSIYVPECYFEGRNINSYNIENAPIFFPNTVGGYKPGIIGRPGKTSNGQLNTTVWALLHGYVVVSAGVRGRMMQDESGDYIGVAPAAICDLKAVVRYLRYNRNDVPGNVEKIISNGTSAGGALSALLGATGNHPDYEPYLQKMGAALEKDHIFAASCYCPITNLEHADMAYEWEFEGINDYYRMQMVTSNSNESKVKKVAVKETMDSERQNLSAKLKQQFSSYINSLRLVNINGDVLELDDEGNGSFKQYIKAFIIESAQKELDKGTNLKEFNWLVIKEEQIVDVDFTKLVEFRTRMKQTPAFDSVDNDTAENELFGSSKIQFRHFTEFSKFHSRRSVEMAEERQIKMMNPMCYIEDKKVDKAQFFRIRHGLLDRDTSLAIPAILYSKLISKGINVDFEYPWGIAHAGDYDLNELFEWIDQACK